MDCCEWYEQGRGERASRPLPYGKYKLEECQSRLGGCRDEIGRIRDVVTGGASRWSLMHCTAEDKHAWLKRLPLHVAYRLSYEVLPGLLALAHDGADPHKVNAAYPGIKKACADLLDRLESARQAIRGNIQLEYSGMRSGGSLLEPLVGEAMQITRQALDVLQTQ